MWERNLQDLVRGLRANKGDQSRFIAEAIDEIRREVRGDDMELKAAAVLKLTYLEMLGYDMSWASFHVVEVMSSPRFHLKSMGYLAATQSFEQDTDVLMLTTNLLKKDITSAKPLDVSVSLNGLSHIVTPDLARDLSRDLVTLLSHSHPSIRKRAVLALYKVVIKYPEALQYGIEKLKERLEDPDPGVVGAVVNILCELARHNAKDFLVFAPPLFHILTTSSNNWMLIKVIKLFGLLTPYEPRLIKKLHPPIVDLISTTPAVSLLYECVHTCIIGGMLQGSSGFSLAQTCVTKLAAFLEDSDQNLKYISLLALAKIVPTHPHLIAEYESRILSSVDDQDISIRMRALDLLSAMVNQNNLQSIVQQLLQHLVKPDSSLNTTQTAAQSLTTAAASTSADRSLTTPSVVSPSSSTAYRTTLANRILSMCAADLYANVSDFQWYVSVLVDLAYVARAPVGAVIRDQLVDIAVRVREVRRYAVQVSMRILEDSAFISGAKEDPKEGCEEVLWAAGWICGEYSSELSDTRRIIPSLLSPDVSQLSSETVSVYIQSAAKIFGTWAAGLTERWDEDDLPELKKVVGSTIDYLRAFSSNPNFEVQERATNIMQLFNFIRADLNAYKPRSRIPEQSNGFADASTSAFDPVGTTDPSFPKSLLLLDPLFTPYTLNPVAPEAQSSVPVPEGLDLDAWIVPEANIALRHEKEKSTEKKKKKDKKGKAKETGLTGERVDRSAARSSKTRTNAFEVGRTQEEVQAEQEEIAKAKARRMEMLKDDPYYIIDDRPKVQPDDVDSIPVVRLDDMPALNSMGSPKATPPLSMTPPPQNLRSASPAIPVSFTINRAGEMPPNAISPKLPSGSLPKQSPLGTPRSSTPSRLVPPSPYPTYEVDEGGVLPRATTPEMIKVTRTKKKKSTTDGSSKKKKPKDTAAVDQVNGNKS
ncbi:Adaptor protein complex AP-3 delta subunit [Schizopora paradoxa]|uniref:AP-3 complex subunit delta n=1 Tax=Schizopora paradoxa TaxID=27342 RepID=A0A0H2R9Y5_9AGAM|nr:Adaptor protein complex AP-3 delta subunit [Schizopora paradoxa]